MLSIDEAKVIVTDLTVLKSIDFEDVPVSTLVEVLKLSDTCYFNETDSVSEIFMSDEQYDTIKLFAQRSDPTNLYFTGIGSEVRGGKIQLPHKMGSLNQVYEGDYPKWVAKHNLGYQNVVISDKLDGASDLMVFAAHGKLQIAYSRGDGERGADITRHISKIPSVPRAINHTGSITVRAETIISDSNFERIKKLPAGTLHREYKNPRNMVSGLMNSSSINPMLYEFIDVVAYEIVGSNLSKSEQLKLLRRLGFKVVNHSVHVAGQLDDEKLTTILNDVRTASDYALDGVVIDVDSTELRAKIRNPEELNPEYAVKFKVADAANVAYPIVEEIEWRISKDGYYKPRVRFVPVELMGVTVKHATGFNAAFIRDNKIGPGAQVKITRSGDVIPYIQEVIIPANEAQMPDDEDAIWTPTLIDLVVPDIANNVTAKFERLNSFFDSIDVPHLGESNLRAMFDAGFDSPESIITLTIEDIQNLIGSRTNGKKIFTNMREKLTNIELYKLMGAHHAFGRGVGVRKMKKLYDAFNGDMTQCQLYDKVVAVEGFERKTASKVVAGYPVFMQFLSDVEGFVTIAEYVPDVVGKFTGMTFVFTGFRNAQLEQQVVGLGGKMGSTVSRKTTYLVTAEPDSTSTKAVKAREVGVQVIGLEQLKGLM